MKSACMVWFSLVQTALYSETGLPAVPSYPRAVWRKNAVRTCFQSSDGIIPPFKTANPPTQTPRCCGVSHTAHYF
ncbi:hypothetical protein FPQ50_28185, partial [Klebsiella pneumoniae]